MKERLGLPILAAMELFIARQPVFDRSEKVFAYDLAALSQGPEGFHQEPSPEEFITRLFLDVGIDRVAQEQRVFLALDRELLLSHHLPAIPQSRVIFDVPPALSANPEAMEACRSLRAAGYRLSTRLSRAQIETGLTDELSRIADVVRVDVGGTDGNDLQIIADALVQCEGRLLAMNVAHRGERDRCIDLGFELFQGFRFAAPATLSNKVVPIQHLHAFQLLQLVRDMSVSDEEIELFLRRDVGLAYRLLRMVNSAAVGGREISSIGHALRLLGRESLSRWLCVLLAVQASDNGVQSELIHLALVRARMCERIGDAMGRHTARGAQFLVGMLSVFDQLLEVQMDTLCSSVGVARELRDALVTRAGMLGDVLTAASAYTDGEWLDANLASAALGLDADLLPSLYMEALAWASGGCGPTRPARVSMLS